MKKDSIVQFVCFITSLKPGEFAPHWEQYVQTKKIQDSEPVLLQQSRDTKSRFGYISFHKWLGDDNASSKPSGRFPESVVRTIQASGYEKLSISRKRNTEDHCTRLLAFISQRDSDIDIYKQSTLYNRLDIFQAYYESCVFGYILDFLVPDKHVVELTTLLNHSHGVEVGIYKECNVMSLSR